MSGEIHPVSETLGALKTDVKYLRERADVRDREQAEMKKMLESISTKLDPVVTDHTWMKPHVESYAAVRGRVGWAGAFIVGIASIFGGTVGNWLLRKYGG
ncbi:hypothetical protein [Bradyrhizobium stylosanthis]|uniref:Uncharacterized protein n=1 Tax=Bradyrhizobium stylosanthis TaxID=1803665 RepID=A0A560CXI2_9BRAD|nr:hypothetical protein [Bradyrhizobium stylosanthis]TWA89572.1 hypothetical protein FBZ96_11940 [Bradyrhizobium stylosanthis]